jgi:hypothetical protein
MVCARREINYGTATLSSTELFFGLFTRHTDGVVSNLLKVST